MSIRFLTPLIFIALLAIPVHGQDVRLGRQRWHDGDYQAAAYQLAYSASVGQEPHLSLTTCLVPRCAKHQQSPMMVFNILNPYLGNIPDHLRLKAIQLTSQGPRANIVLVVRTVPRESHPMNCRQSRLLRCRSYPGFAIRFGLRPVTQWFPYPSTRPSTMRLWLATAERLLTLRADRAPGMMMLRSSSGTMPVD